MPTRRTRAYTLLEILLVLSILTVAVFGVLRFFRSNAVQASVQKEQTNLAALVNGVQGMFSAQGSYAGVSSQVVAAQNIPGVPVSSNHTGIVSAFGGTVTVQPATVQVPNDAFQVMYAGLSTAQCVNLIPAVAGNAYAITIGSNTASVVSQGAVGTGQLLNPADVAAQCAAEPANAGLVVLTYYTPKQGAGPIAGAPSCTAACAPQTQNQTLSCPGAEVGQIEQTRQGTCVGAPCPALTWGAWTTTSSSCATAPTPPGAPVTPTPPPPACSPSTQYQALACPAGDVGRIWQQKAITCVGGVPTASGWSTISNNCAPPSSNPTTSTGCTTHVINGTTACPAGEGGQITTKQNVTCDASGNPVYGPVTPVSNTCQASCALTGTCCTVGSQTGPQQTVSCASGQYGQIIDGTTQYSTCASATSAPAWGAPQVTSTSGSCTACPAPATVYTGRSLGPVQTSACPAGYTGSITWQEIYNNYTTTAYNCAGAPVSLPAATVTTAQTDTGTSQQDSNTCSNACSSGAFSNVGLVYQGQPDFNGQSQSGEIDLDSFPDCVSAFVNTQTGSQFGAYTPPTTAQAQAECAEIFNEVSTLIQDANGVAWGSNPNTVNMSTQTVGQGLVSLWTKYQGQTAPLGGTTGPQWYYGIAGNTDPGLYVSRGLCSMSGASSGTGGPCDESAHVYVIGAPAGTMHWPTNGTGSCP